MYWWVSAALRKHILANFKISATEFDDVLEGAVKDLANHPAPDETSGFGPGRGIETCLIFSRRQV